MVVRLTMRQISSVSFGDCDQPHRPANAPSSDTDRAMHARDAEHARIFVPQRFVTIEDKESKIQLFKPRRRSKLSVISKLKIRELA